MVAPFFVGDRRAPRFVGEGRFPWHPGRRARLAEARQIGDVVLLRYALSERCPTNPADLPPPLAVQAVLRLASVDDCGAHLDPAQATGPAGPGGPGR